MSAVIFTILGLSSLGYGIDQGLQFAGSGSFGSLFLGFSLVILALLLFRLALFLSDH